MPRLGVGAMTWGTATGINRFSPAKMAYGGTEGVDEERKALETSLARLGRNSVDLYQHHYPYSRTPAQVALRWLIENECVLPIPGAKNGKHAADNAGALSFQLTPEEIKALSQATLAWRK